MSTSTAVSHVRVDPHVFSRLKRRIPRKSPRRTLVDEAMGAAMERSIRRPQGRVLLKLALLVARCDQSLQYTRVLEDCPDPNPVYAIRGRVLSENS